MRAKAEKSKPRDVSFQLVLCLVILQSRFLATGDNCLTRLQLPSKLKTLQLELQVLKAPTSSFCFTCSIHVETEKFTGINASSTSRTCLLTREVLVAECNFT